MSLFSPIFFIRNSDFFSSNFLRREIKEIIAKLQILKNLCCWLKLPNIHI